jgi:hypothetical protein
VSDIGSGEPLVNLVVALAVLQYTLENIEGAIKNGQSRETGKIGCTKRRKTKQNHHYTLNFYVIKHNMITI